MGGRPGDPRAGRFAGPRPAACPGGRGRGRRPLRAPRGRIFTAVNAVWLAAAGLLAAGLLVGAAAPRAWDAAGFAVAPVLVLLWPITWDLLAAAAVAAALWGWARGRPAVAGVALGLGAAVSPLVALLLVPLAVVGRRDGGWRGRAARRGGRDHLAAGRPAGVRLVPDRVGGVLAGLPPRRRRGSVWLLVQQAGNTDLSRATVLTASGSWWPRGCGGGGPRAAHPALARRLGALAVAGTLLVSPASAPSYALVLLPLAALAVPRWRDLLVWQAGEVAHFALLGWYLGGLLAPAGGGDARAYWWGDPRPAPRPGLAGRGRGAERRPGKRATASADDDAVEVRGGEAHPDVDVLADGGHARA